MAQLTNFKAVKAFLFAFLSTADLSKVPPNKGFLISAHSDLPIGYSSLSDAQERVWAPQPPSQSLFQLPCWVPSDLLVNSFTASSPVVCSHTTDNKDAEKPLETADKDTINALAFQCERILHGNPSGVDNSVCTYGSFLRFSKPGGMHPAASTPGLKLLITNTRQGRETMKLVAGVGALLSKYPTLVGDVLALMDKIALRYLDLLAETSNGQHTQLELLDEFGVLIDLNQHQLNAIGVGHAKLTQVVETAAKFNLHAKLTGAGGGGCAFTLLRPDTPPDVATELKAELTLLGFESFEVEIGVPGAQLFLL